ncbi:hypothetical protein SR41_08355 [Sphingomonas melonis]|uniref:Pectate lyase superfamily protein domain-containing protein n=1 Tax=Sphingomonas melonis TaxID=152682 RepID=A0A0D1MCC3_9SPHN|nr:hypothetical protein [Sphingomonas melonis]KIU28227.1 hypothetical protein SR41_08355 [Sphingomonas melonis]
MTPIDRRVALALLAAGQSALVGAQSGQRLSLSAPPLGKGNEARLRDKTVNVVDYGARADDTTDNAAAFDRAVERGLALGKPLLIPPSRGAFATSRPLRPLTGLIGMGRQSCIKAISRAPFAAGQPIVHIGWTRAENGEPCRVPIQDVRILGAAHRTERRTANRAAIQFAGSGLFYDEMTGPTHAFGVEVSHCLKGIVHANATGHIGGTALNVSNCWYNLYWERNTGDYRYYDCVFTGALFATYGCHGSNRIDGVDPGGISGLLLSGCHGGFAPYGFYQEDGDGTVGLVGLTLQNASFEQIGNAVVRTGRQTSGGQRVSCSWDVTTPGHTWTDHVRDAAAYDMYTIVGDADHPIQEVAVSLDLVQGGPLFLRGNCWESGRSGYHTRIRNLLEWIEDSRGSAGYDIQQQGRERVLSPPRRFATHQAMPPRLSGPVTRIARFDCPAWIDGAGQATIDLSGSVDNDTGKPVRLQVRIIDDQGAPQIVGLLTIAAGPSDYTFRRAFELARIRRKGGGRTLVVELVGNGEGLSFAPAAIAGQVMLTLDQG